MSKRKPIAASELYIQLDREFRQRRPRECASCYLLLPYRVDRNDGPNWEVILPPTCGHGCSDVIEELVAEYGLRYDLETETETRG
jgi:hypothetical protein